jgi:hypothetical protein
MAGAEPSTNDVRASILPPRSGSQKIGAKGVKVDFLNHEAKEVIDLYRASCAMPPSISS